MVQARLPLAEELEELKRRLLAMGGLAEERLRMVVRALVNRDHDTLALVIAGDSRIDDLQIEIDDRCFTLLALHQPVAVDLRTVVSTIKINADLERVGDLAVNIGEAAQRYFLHQPVKPLIDLPRMGDLALLMLNEALEAFVSRDVRLARNVLRQDDWLDALKNQIFRELLTYMLGDPRTIEPGTPVAPLSGPIVDSKRVAELKFEPGGQQVQVFARGIGKNGWVKTRLEFGRRCGSSSLRPRGSSVSSPPAHSRLAG